MEKILFKDTTKQAYDSLYRYLYLSLSQEINKKRNQFVINIQKILAN